MPFNKTRTQTRNKGAFAWKRILEEGQRKKKIQREHVWQYRKKVGD